jgi:hypothetical protein
MSRTVRPLESLTPAQRRVILAVDAANAEARGTPENEERRPQARGRRAGSEGTTTYIVAPARTP